MGSSCPACGHPLAAGKAGGLCARCLLAVALRPPRCSDNSVIRAPGEAPALVSTAAPQADACIQQQVPDAHEEQPSPRRQSRATDEEANCPQVSSRK